MAMAATRDTDGGGSVEFGDASGLIDPSKFPTIDPAKIDDAATKISTMGKGVHDNVSQLNTKWKGLRSCYHAPEQESVYAMQDPAEKASKEIKDTLDKASTALNDFADALDQPKKDLTALASEAQTFRDSVIGGVWVDEQEVDVEAMQSPTYDGYSTPMKTVRKLVNWKSDHASVDRNNELMGKANGIIARISSAEATCANAIQALVTGKCMPAAQSYTAEQLDAAENLPWGGHAKYQARDCSDSVVEGVKDFGEGIKDGAAGLVGYNPKTGQFFDGNIAGQAWGGMVNVLGSLVVTATVGNQANVLKAMGANDPVTNWIIERNKTSATAVAGLVNIDLNAKDPLHKWKEDPVRAFTSMGLNIGTFFIPGADMGSVVKVGTMGSKVAKMGAFASDLMVPGGSLALKGLIGVTKVGIGSVDDLAKISVKMKPNLLGGLTDLAGGASHLDDLGRGMGRADDLGRGLGRADDLGRGASRLDGLNSLDDAAKGLGESTKGLDELGRVPVSDDLGQATKALDGSSPGTEVADGGPGVPEAGDPPGASPSSQPSDPRRVYLMEDGSEHIAQYAPESLPRREHLDKALQQMGMTEQDAVRLVNKPTSTLTPAEVKTLYQLRDAVPPPTEGSIIQKVLEQPHFDNNGELVQGAAQKYRDRSYTTIQGYVTDAGDTAHLSTPESIQAALRLDYPGTSFTGADLEVNAIRFPADGATDFQVPRNTDMGGSPYFDMNPEKGWNMPPFTGNGFTKAADQLIPEFRIDAAPHIQPTEIPQGAEMWQLTPGGTQRLVGVWTGKKWLVVR